MADTPDAVADAWIYSSLNVAGLTGLIGTAPGGTAAIYSDQPDPETAFPFVLFRQVVPFAADSSQGSIFFMRAQYAIFAKAQAAAYPFAIAKKIVELIHKQRVHSGDYVIWAEQIATWRDAYSVDGKPYREQGARFLIQLKRHN